MIERLFLLLCTANVLVLVSSGGVPPQDPRCQTVPCNKNERWVECPSSLCVPATCDQLGQPLSCPRIIPGRCPDKPACVCIEGYVRNRKGLCVPKKQCPTCGGDPNSEAGCGYLCGPRCDGKQAKLTPCPCEINGCQCKSGFIYDDTTRRCVPPCECPKKCPNNEVWNTCANGGCRKWNCTQIDQGTLCIDPIRCIGDCICKKGYLRSKEGKCIPEEECRKNLCPRPNEVYDSCPLACPPRKCGIDDRAVLCLADQPCLPAGCRCKDGTYKDPTNNNICVPWEECPKKCPRNEVWSTCANGGCGKWNCTQIDEPILCIDPIKCVGDCICKKGYLRSKEGKCIPQEDCRKNLCPKPNEVYDRCPLACPPRKCGIDDRAVLCRDDQPCLPAGCRCKDGTYRDDDDNCVLWDDCPPEEYCEEEPTEEPTTIAPGDCPDDLEQRLIEAIVNLTGIFLSDSMQRQPGVNLVMSAASLFTPLGQLAAFSEGNTLKQFLSVLNLSSKDFIRCVFPPFLKSLSGDTNVILNLAVRIFATDKFPLSQNFLDYTRDVFEAAAESLDFSNGEAAAERINEWAANATNDRINDIAKKEMFTPDTRLVLANAMYFLGNWEHQFNPNNTEDRDFHVSKDKTIQIPIMYQQNTFKYGHSDKLKAQVLVLPYKGDNFSFGILLPDTIDGLPGVVQAAQDPDTFNEAFNSTTLQKVQVYVPRIKIDSEYDLTEILKEVGITDVFDASKSNLDGILQEYEPLIISDGVQKCSIDMDETGTEAAVVNVLTVGTTSVQLPPNVVNCDHPFAYYILFQKVPIFSGIYLT